MRVTLEPHFTGPAEAGIPSSKSLGHRALIAAALAEGTSFLYGLGMSKDIEATMNAMKTFGAVFEQQGDQVTVHGCGGKLYADTAIDCCESGSTLRFLIPLAALDGTETRFSGQGRLMKRPLDVYEKIFAEQNLPFEQSEEGVRLCGPLKAGVYTVDGNISSQFISGLLFALPLLDGDSEIRIKEPFESASYVTLTLETLKAAGIRIGQEGLTFRVPGNQTYRPVRLTVDGDDSQAAFFAGLALTARIPVSVHGISHESKQPDHVIFSLLKDFGARISETEDGYLVCPEEIKAIHADLSDCPDLGPVLFALAGTAEGTSVFTGCGRLRIKESDRIAAMQEELAKLGVRLEAEDDTVYVTGTESIQGGVTLDGHNDHRIVMALSVLAACAQKPVSIEGAQAVNKSYPGFFSDLEKTGMEVTYD